MDESDRLRALRLRRLLAHATPQTLEGLERHADWEARSRLTCRRLCCIKGP